MTCPMLGPDSVRRLARAACLHLEDNEVETLARDLSSLLGCVAVLMDDDLGGADDEPRIDAMDLRRDVLSEGLSVSQAIEQSGRAVSDGFEVPVATFRPRLVAPNPLAW